MSRIASAPISWGICEVPGWGAMLPTERVLREMSALGLPATEIGAPGFLPASPDDLRQTLDGHGMSLIGGFTPFVLHDSAKRESAIEDATRVADLFAACGATHLVTAVVMDEQWSIPRPLDNSELQHLMQMLGILDEICGERGLHQVLHPHVQTVVETRDDIHRVLDGCDVRWCLDTGHLAIGGQDPAEFARQAADRVGHVHLKDVNLDLAPGLLRREYSIMQGVQRNLFTPLGQGDVPIAEVIEILEGSGYRGWYVIEQDTAILGDPPAEGAGPVTSVEQSMNYLREVVAPRLAAAGS